MKNKPVDHDYQVTSGQVITPNHLIYAGLILLSMLAGLASLYVEPLLIIGAILGLAIVVLVCIYEFAGLNLYLLLFLLRPGEMYPALAPLRLELMVGALLGFTVLLKNNWRHGNLFFPRSKLNIDYLLLVGALCLSLVFSFCKDCTIDTIEAIVKLGVFYILITLIVDSRKRLEIFFWVFIGLNMYVAGGIMWDFFVEGVYRDYHGLARATGGSSAFDNMNGLAITMNTIIPFMFYLFLYYKDVFRRMAMGLMLAVGVVTLMLTGSRGGLLGFMAIIGMIWWRSKQKAVMTVVIGIVVIGGWFTMGEKRQERYLSMFSVSEERDESAQGRIDAWIDGMYLFAKRPITGVGAGAFAVARWETFSVYLQPHSMYVQILAELGLVGGFIFFMFVYDIFRLNRKVVRDVEETGTTNALMVPLSNAITLACFSLLVTGVFAHSGYRFSWYLFSALTVVTVRAYTDERKETARLVAEAPPEPQERVT